jgi:predicted transposase YbfD/YdcC
MKSLEEALREVVDRRSRRGRRYELTPVLIFACTGMLCGCRSLRALAAWGRRQEREFLRMMGLPRGQAPSFSTLRRILSTLDITSFERALSSWAVGVVAQQRAQRPRSGYRGLALDGKVLKGSRQGELPGVHVLAALAHDVGMALDQEQVKAETNEHKASLPLLARLTLTDQVVTADAAFMQRDVCCLITQRRGHYLIVLKDNQPQLRQDVLDWFAPFPPPDECQMAYAEEVNSGHGRIERRRLWALPIYADCIAWPGARLMLRLERSFTNKRSHKTTVELDYALCSLGLDQVSAEELLALWRGHWHIENRLHWVRDGTLGEDACRVRTGQAPQALAAIGNVVITTARLAGFTNIAEALRTYAQYPERALLHFILL